jgi:hypothetical protein
LRPRTEELHERGVQERGAGIVVGRQQRCRVQRDEPPGVVRRAVAEAGVGDDPQEAARPEAEPVRIDVQRVVGVAPELPASVAASTQHPLRGEEQIHVEEHALLPELVPEPKPVPGESVSLPQISTPGRGHVDGLSDHDTGAEEHVESQQDNPWNRTDAGSRIPTRLVWRAADGPGLNRGWRRDAR